MTRMVSICEIAEVNPSFPRASGLNPFSLVSFLPMAAVSESGEITNQLERPLGEVSKGFTYFAEGDVLMAKITPCMENGKATFVQKLKHPAGFGSTEFHVLRPGSEIDGKYLFYMIWNPMFRKVAERNMTGTAGQKRVPSSFLKDHKIPLPPLPEQKRIAAILDKADSIRRKRQEAVRLTEELLRSAFLEMFGDPVTNPKGWEIKRLGDLGQVVSGLQVSSKRAANLEVPYLRVANVYRDMLLLKEIKTIQISPAEFERARLSKGDLLIVEGHGNPEEIGRSAVWDGSIEPCVHQNHLIRVQIDTKQANSSFVSAYLNSSGGRQQLLKCGKTTSGLNTINTTNVKNTHIFMPPLFLQQQYIRFVERILSVQEKMQNSYKKEDSLFNSLLQRIFKGELGSN